MFVSLLLLDELVNVFSYSFILYHKSDHMRIPIPEMDKRYDSVEDAIDHTVRICTVIIDKACEKWPTPSVSDMPGYILVICRKILTQFSTLTYVSRQRNDYNTVCSLVRILADSIATLNLIYCCDDDEERIIRHLLYVLDGISERDHLLNERYPEYDGRISRELFNSLCTQYQEAKENAKGCIKYCIETIKKSPYYSTHQVELDVLIQRRNWKFKTISEPKPKDGYSWKDMYQMLKINMADEMFPYLSQYIHGLSISNILLNDKDDFDAPLSFAFCLLGWLLIFLRRVYGPHIEEYTIEDIKRMMPNN